MLLTEEHQLIQDSARALADKIIRPYCAQWDQEHIFPRQALSELAQAGFMGMLIPQEWGGANADHLAYVLVIQEIARADAGLSTILSVQNSLVSLPLLKFGTITQKEQFLRPLAQGQKLGAFCLTEPQAGSDAGNLKTTAVRVGDHFILNGVKQFITCGKEANLAIVFAQAKTDHQEGITAFVIPTDLPGYHVAKIEQKMGQHSAPIAQIVFDEMKIPANCQLGNIGDGYKIALSNLECGRLGIAAQSIGMAQEALSLSLNYAKERKTFDHFLSEHQAIRFKLADMATQLEAATQLLYHTTTMRDQQIPCLKQAAMAKLFASEAAEKICHEAMQIFGGYGYLKDFPLERIYRDVRVTSIYEGTSEIQRLIIARELLHSYTR